MLQKSIGAKANKSVTKQSKYMRKSQQGKCLLDTQMPNKVNAFTLKKSSQYITTNKQSWLNLQE